jgi:hypothetical protein
MKRSRACSRLFDLTCLEAAGETLALPLLCAQKVAENIFPCEKLHF